VTSYEKRTMETTIRIDKIITGGLGIGRMEDGMVVMTGRVLPDETVVVRGARQHRGYLEAELVTVLEPSGDRVEPVCPRYAECGGCDLQHARETAQHRIKEDILAEAAGRARLVCAEGVLQPLLASPLALGYRHRIRLALSAQGEIGFYQARSNRLVPIHECPVATAKVNTALAELNRSKYLRRAAAFAREIELLHSPADGRVIALLRLDNRKRADQGLIREFASSLAPIAQVLVQAGRRIRPGAPRQPDTVLRQQFDRSICGQPFSLSWSPGCFSQVNAYQNSRLIGLVCRLSGDGRGQRILDLFCGMGNFSVPLGLGQAAVTGIERNRESIARARTNVAAAGLHDCEFQDIDVAAGLRQCLGAGRHFDCVVLDPPRQGLGKSTSLLLDLAPGRIISVSCDPATMMRDLSLLIAGGYKLLSLTPVDMFPQTHHIESVALLEKN